MIECGSLDFAQARLQSRHGQRVGEVEWRRIELVRELRPMLEVARVTALRPWLVGITADCDVHRVETTLRAHWRAAVDEAAGWMPTPWQSAVQWCAVVPELAPLQHLARGEEAAAWMRADALWSAVLQAPPPARAAALGATPLAALKPAWKAPDTAGAAWVAEWQRRLPAPLADCGDALPELVQTVSAHTSAFKSAAAGPGWPLRAALQERLLLQLRRATLQPAALFIHLALRALELERLRAELMRRLLFPRWKVA